VDETGVGVGYTSCLGVGGVFMELSASEMGRYSRHLNLPEVGEQGQLRLKNASVLVIGTGGLGSPALLYLAAAGVGRIGLVDFDQVEASNLQRQVLFGTQDLGQSKVETATKRLKDLNPYLCLDPIETRIHSGNALEILSPYEIILDGSDNFSTRYLINDACVLLDKPCVSAAIYRFEGQLSVFHYDGGPCYRCIYPEPPPTEMVPNCAEGGVLGVLPGVLGVLQAAEAIKIILGVGRVASGVLLLYNALTLKFREMKLRKSETCPMCSKKSSISELSEIQQSCTLDSQEVEEISVQTLKAYRDEGRDFILLDVREPHELRIAKLDPHILIPLGQLESRLAEVDSHQETIVICRSGKRSHTACDLMMSRGFSRVKNLTGGILAWANEIDSSLEQY
jgi:sulfur-carrier protein adenylyltransferase/sulfurtransferase